MLHKAIAVKTSAGLIRHLLGFVGALMVARGWVDTETATVVANYASDQIIGLLLSSAAVGWSWLDKIDDRPIEQSPLVRHRGNNPVAFEPVFTDNNGVGLDHLNHRIQQMVREGKPELTQALNEREIIIQKNQYPR